jgi:SAM-dependent methyltransferase
MVVSLLMPLALVTLVQVVGANLAGLAYLPYVIVSCALFGLGTGLGADESRRGQDAQHARPDSRGFAQFSLAVLLAVACGLTPVGQMGMVADAATYFRSLVFYGWTLGQELGMSTIILVLLQLVILCFRSLGAQLAELSVALPGRLVLERLLVGSAAGALLFTLGAGMCFHVLVWLTLVTALWRPSGRNLTIACVLLLAVAAASWRPPAAAGLPDDLWTPYQHIRTYPCARDGKLLGFLVKSNGVPSQTALDLSLDEPDRRRVDSCCAALGTGPPNRDLYELPFVVHPKPARVLVLGAGTGNDVQACLKHGAQQVDAVELDPGILAAGRHHPQNPYAGKGVRTHVMDARSFLKSGSDQYDLILVARLDSLAAASPFSPVRHSDYVYTVEGVREMARRLAPGGHLLVAFDTTRKWLRMRLVRNLREVFRIVDGAAILDGGMCLVTTHEHLTEAGPQLARAAGVISVPDAIWLNESSLEAVPTTDDWPFLAVKEKAIPLPYLWSIYLVVALFMWNARSTVAGWVEKLAGQGETIGRPAAAAAFLFGAGVMLLFCWGVHAAQIAAGCTLATTGISVAAALALGWLMLRTVLRQPLSGRQLPCLYGSLCAMGMACALLVPNFAMITGMKLLVVPACAALAGALFFWWKAGGLPGHAASEGN